MTETDAALPRETGAEKASTTCPTCGSTLKVVETPYGSTAPEACPKCYPASDSGQRQQASTSATLPREQGTGVAGLPQAQTSSGGGS